MQPTLHTQRLALLPATPDDVDALWALWTDPEVRRFLWDDRTISLDEATATLADCLALAPQGLGLWVVHLQSAAAHDVISRRTMVGCAALLPVSTAAEHDVRLAGMIEVLVALAPGVWGRGYATESLRELLRHAEHTLGLLQLAGVTDVPNSASDRMLRRAGFEALGEVPGPLHQLRTYVWRAEHLAAE